MGKKQHQSDKTYVSANEYAWYYGGKNAEKTDRTAFRRLPFDHCALSLQPFHDPYATRDGHVFDLSAILPYIQKYSNNPINGKPLDLKSLIRLKFSKNQKGEYHCPITYKVFTINSHIVAVATTGNVYSGDAVNELNIKQKNWKDLMDDTPFKRTDIITIQDPNDVEKFNITNFFHLQHNLTTKEDEDTSNTRNLRVLNSMTSDALKELESSYSQKQKEFIEKVSGGEPEPEKNKKALDSVNVANYSLGKVGASLTSTIFQVSTKQEAAVLDEYTVKYKYVKKKGYARLVTNFGDLNIELFCQECPKTCDNFLTHVTNGYYKGTIFHRLIKHFVLQGGDPTGTGGESAFPDGKPFEDEIRPQLTHSGRGVLSMANSGANTNKSQFFLSFRSCKHLDGKHTVFGKMVGGMDCLNRIEQIKTDKEDRPLEEVKILDTVVFVNPFKEAEEKIAQLRQQETSSLDKERLDGQPKQSKLVKYKNSGVGQYLNLPSLKRAAAASEGSGSDVRSIASSVLSAETGEKLAAKKSRLASTQRKTFSNFSAW